MLPRHKYRGTGTWNDDLTFNGNTIGLLQDNISGATAYALIRITTAHKMTFNSPLTGSTRAHFGYDTPSGGTFVLGGNSTYSGGTIVGAGTVVIQNGTGATGQRRRVGRERPSWLQFGRHFTWNTSTATIGGSVTVGGASGFTALLGPAGGIASLHIGGSLTFNNYSEPILSLSSTSVARMTKSPLPPP